MQTLKQDDELHVPVVHYEVRKHQGELRTAAETRFCIVKVQGSKVISKLPGTYDTRGEAKKDCRILNRT